MEADWEIEIGGEAPVIEAYWSGFVDLRANPERVRELSEVLVLPGLSDALVQLNGPASPIWTAKCDVWTMEHGVGFDADELDAPLEDAGYAIACYLDLLPRLPKMDGQWPPPSSAITDAKAICNRLKAVTLSCCRADLIIRRAIISPEREDTGITAYLTACGATQELAGRTLEMALKEFVDVLCEDSTVK